MNNKVKTANHRREKNLNFAIATKRGTHCETDVIIRCILIATIFAHTHKKKMVYHGRISAYRKAKAFLLSKTSKLTYSQIAKECKISKSSAWRLRKEENEMKRKSSSKVGRHKKLKEREIRCLKRGINQLRKENVNFTVKELVQHCGMDTQKVSYRTYVRAMYSLGYRNLQTRKKGL